MPGVVCKRLTKVDPVDRVIIPKDVGGILRILILLEEMAGGNEVMARGSDRYSNRHVSVKMMFRSDKDPECWSYWRSIQECDVSSEMSWQRSLRIVKASASVPTWSVWVEC